MPNKQAKGKKQAPTVRSSAPGVTARYIVGILLIALGTAGVLSLVASGGSFVMTLIRSYLSGLAGQFSPALPFLLIWLGAALAVSCYHRVSFRAPVFALLLYLNVLALITCATRVDSHGYLMDYIKTYNNQHFTSNSFLATSLPAYCQRLFNWGYRGNPLAAGGALSQIFAYPAYLLFGAVGSWILEAVLTLACAFVLLHIRPTRIIRGTSDTLERWRLKRNGFREQQREPEAVQPEVSPIREQKPEYASASNPYTNVRWIYDEPQAEQPDIQPADNPFMRPGTMERQEQLDVFSQPAPSGPFTPMNNGDDLYHEPFVLHDDGAYEVTGTAAEPPANARPVEEPLPWEDQPETDQAFRPPVANRQTEKKQPAPVMPAEPVFDEPAPAPKPAESRTPSKRAEKQPAVSDEREEPVRTAKPEPSRKPAPQPVIETEAPEDDESNLSDWQVQLKKLQQNLSETRQQRRDLDEHKTAKPVHTATVDLPEISHVPISPASSGTGNRLDKTPDMPKPVQPAVKNGPYTPPPMNFLSMPKAVNPGESAQEDQYRAQQIERTLKTFNVDAQVREITHGPAITRFALKLAEGVKVKQVTSVLDNLMLEMGSDRLRLETPIPGTSYIGIEAPNNIVSPVTLREVLDSPEMHNARSPLAVALGKDIAGKPIIGDLSRMPHLLIAGATGSGKSVCINSIVCSLLYRTSPKDVRLIMVDPKQVELQVYNGIPHLLIPVVCDPKKAAVALNWTVNEMLERYGKFSKQNVRNLEGYNKKMPEEDRLPHIVVIIDEMADLMEVCRKDVEESIRRLAALARAAGIYLVLATQRPSVDVITGVIKNNIPSRIAFTVSSGVDSRTIIDINGAEKLMGKGDMLYLPVGASKPMRVQGCFVTDDEVARIAENIQTRYRPDYNHSIQDVLEKPTDSGSDQEDPSEPVNDMRESEFSDLLSEAIRMAVQDGSTSISMLQRTLRIGYARAGRIIDEMTKRGIISESEGSKARKTIITRDEYVKMMSEGLLNGNGNQ